MCVKFSFYFNFSVHKNLLPKTTDFFTLKTLISTGSLIKFSYSPLMEFPQHFFLIISLLCLVVFFCSKCEIHYFIFCLFIFFFLHLLYWGEWKKIFLLFFCLIFSRIWSAFAAISSVVFHLLFFLSPAFWIFFRPCSA